MSDYITAAILNGIVNYGILFLICAFIEYCIYRYYKKKHIHVSQGFLIGYQLLTLLIITILSITGIGNIKDFFVSLGDKGFGTLFLEFNKDGLQHYDGRMNVLMFIPFGMFLPMVFSSARKWYYTWICGSVLSLLIEISQTFNYRTSDINDLFSNSIGTFIGYFIFLVFLRKIHIFLLEDQGKLSKCHHYIQILILFLMFFLIGSPLISLLNSF